MSSDSNPYKSSSTQSEITKVVEISAPQRTLFALVRSLAAILGCMLVVLLLSGLAHGIVPLRDMHRWSGHWLVILHWLLLPFAIVSLLFYKLLRTPLLAIAQSFLLLFSLVVSVAASVTGYLGPLSNPDNSDETNNRFIVLHMVVLPSIYLALLVIWYLAFRLPKDSRS